jgi:hypothetical protein
MGNDERGGHDLENRITLDHGLHLVSESSPVARRRHWRQADTVGLQPAPHMPLDVLADPKQTVASTDQRPQPVACLALDVDLPILAAAEGFL